MFHCTAALNCDKQRDRIPPSAKFMIMTRIQNNSHRVQRNLTTNGIPSGSFEETLINQHRVLINCSQYHNCKMQIVTQKASTMIYKTIEDRQIIWLCFSYCILALSLFVSWIFTDYSDTSFSFNNLTLFADWFY